jgi:hypothetical protein
MKAGSILGLNDKKSISECDGESFRFHISWKGVLRMALKLVKIPPEWTDGLTGNAKVLWDVYEDYKKCEGKLQAGNNLGANDAPAAQHRFDILSKVIPAAIIIYYQDSTYREVCDRMLYQIIQNRHQFRFPPHHLDPACWYRDADVVSMDDVRAGKTTGRRLIYELVIPESEIVSADGRMIVVRNLLEVKNYLASIEGIDHWVSLNTNIPEWVGTGWAYRVYGEYGTHAELEKKILFGD